MIQSLEKATWILSNIFLFIMSIHLFHQLPSTPNWLWNRASEERGKEEKHQPALPTSSSGVSYEFQGTLDKLMWNESGPFSCQDKTTLLHRNEWELHGDGRPGERPHKINAHTQRRVFEAPSSKSLTTTTKVVLVCRDYLLISCSPLPGLKTRGDLGLSSHGLIFPGGSLNPC